MISLFSSFIPLPLPTTIKKMLPSPLVPRSHGGHEIGLSDVRRAFQSFVFLLSLSGVLLRPVFVAKAAKPSPYLRERSPTPPLLSVPDNTHLPDDSFSSSSSSEGAVESPRYASAPPHPLSPRRLDDALPTPGRLEEALTPFTKRRGLRRPTAAPPETGVAALEERFDGRVQGPMDTPSTDATRSEEISDERAKSSSDLLQLYPYNSDHRLGYVNRGVPSDPEAVKDIAEMVASMNTDALVVKSKKRHLASAFNQYLPPGQEFTLQAPADAEYPPPPVVFVRGPILGIGGNGLVYEAQTSDGRVYALKSLLVRMKSFSKKAKKEANTGGPAWRHEEDRAFSRVLQKEMHVLKFFPPGKTAEQLYGQGFVLPLFQGILQGKPKVTILSEDYAVTNVVVGFPRVACSVGQLVGAYRLSDAVKLELTRQMIALVARLHSYGILHADVKWENFFLDSTGRVFLGDFEQSQVLREGKTAPCGPRAGGTPSLHEPARAACYFSDPERPLDLMASRDSWCLGMITYKLWCRAFPYHLKFDPNKVPEYMHRLATIEREGTTVDFDRCPESPELPEELQTLISGLLYHDRYLRVLPLSLIYTSSIFEPYLENTDTHASTHHSEMEAR